MDDPQTYEAVPYAAIAPERVVPAAPPALSGTIGDSLAGVLLPQEYVVFASSAHPMYWIRRALVATVALVALLYVSLATIRPIIAGHHHTIAIASTSLGRIALILIGLFLIVSLVRLGKAIYIYIGFSIVTTNRRAFHVFRFFRTSVTPVPNGVMAGSSLRQSLMGRWLGYGNILMGRFTLRWMRNPVALWRALESVAYGVENGTWRPAGRGTFIP